ncbi:hypothetical protein EDC96DRAFT_579970 [Choanephora cucurbitarum]|nr:hypothetical protein EDC96DRAFT_579970 [Choanephora cucurbitarum]
MLDSPFLLVFVHRFIEHIKISNESSDSLLRTLKRRHKAFLTQYRQEMDAEDYGTLDSSTFRCLLKKCTDCQGARQEVVCHTKVDAEPHILRLKQKTKQYITCVLVTYSRVLNEVVASHKRWCLEEMAETMFISLFFSPIARNTFERLNANVFKVDMQDKHMNGYAVKPDYLVSLFSGSGEELNIYSMEAKTPEANKGDLDFVKLANTMKVMVDELVSRGCPLPKAHSFGTLLHGDTMISYEMSLENEGIYIMKELNAVQMPCLIGDLSLLLPMINDMINICEKIKEQAEAIVGLGMDKTEHPFQRPTNWRVREAE